MILEVTVFQNTAKTLILSHFVKFPNNLSKNTAHTVKPENSKL